MGLATAHAIADKLIADGVSPGLPVAVVERGTTADARVLRTLLTDLGDMVVRERVQSPALIIVGKVAARADALDCLGAPGVAASLKDMPRSEEHTSELQSLMRISYAVFCLKKKKNHNKL